MAGRGAAGSVASAELGGGGGRARRRNRQAYSLALAAAAAHTALCGRDGRTARGGADWGVRGGVGAAAPIQGWCRRREALSGRERSPFCRVGGSPDEQGQCGCCCKSNWFNRQQPSGQEEQVGEAGEKNKKGGGRTLDSNRGPFSGGPLDILGRVAQRPGGILRHVPHLVLGVRRHLPGRAGLIRVRPSRPLGRVAGRLGSAARSVLQVLGIVLGEATPERRMEGGGGRGGGGEMIGKGI